MRAIATRPPVSMAADSVRICVLILSTLTRVGAGACGGEGMGFGRTGQQQHHSQRNPCLPLACSGHTRPASATHSLRESLLSDSSGCDSAPLQALFFFAKQQVGAGAGSSDAPQQPDDSSRLPRDAEQQSSVSSGCSCATWQGIAQNSSRRSPASRHASSQARHSSMVVNGHSPLGGSGAAGTTIAIARRMRSTICMIIVSIGPFRNRIVNRAYRRAEISRLVMKSLACVPAGSFFAIRR